MDLTTEITSLLSASCSGVITGMICFWNIKANKRDFFEFKKDIEDRVCQLEGVQEKVHYELTCIKTTLDFIKINIIKNNE